MLSFLAAAALSVAAASSPQRIISLSPNVTEILYGVGAFDRVVAVSRFCEYPDAVKDLPRVGGWTNTSLEQVLGLHADLVILTDAQAPLVEGRLRDLGVSTLVVRGQSLEDIFDAVTAIGEAVGNREQAAELSETMHAELQEVADAVAGRDRPSVLVVVDRLPGMLRDIYVATEGSYLTSLVEIAGGAPITPEAPHEYTQVSAEALASFDPEVVFDMVQALNEPVAVPGVGKLAEDPAAVWESVRIRAVKNHRLYPITDKRLVHPSQFAIQAAREMARRLHPEAFESK